MSVATTFKTRYPMMDAEQDLNGDGIPDGAEIKLKRESTDPDTGSRSVMEANWRKKSSGREPGRPMMPINWRPSIAGEMYDDLADKDRALKGRLKRVIEPLNPTVEAYKKGLAPLAQSVRTFMEPVAETVRPLGEMAVRAVGVVSPALERGMRDFVRAPNGSPVAPKPEQPLAQPRPPVNEAAGVDTGIGRVTGINADEGPVEPYREPMSGLEEGDVGAITVTRPDGSKVRMSAEQAALIGATPNAGMVTTPAPTRFRNTATANDWDQFNVRVDRAADMAGIRRTNTVARPIMEEDQASYLSKAASDPALSLDRRRSAAREFMDLNADRRMATGLESLERRELMQTTGAVAAKRAEAEAMLAAKREMADAMRYQSTAALEMRRSRDQDKAALRAAKDKKTLETEASMYLEKPFGVEQETLRDYILRTYDPKTGKRLQAPKAIDPETGKPIDGDVTNLGMEDRLRDLNEKWQEAYGRPYLGEGLETGGKAAPASKEKMVSFNAQQKAAYSWATQNPSDPRAKAIMKKLGV